MNRLEEIRTMLKEFNETDSISTRDALEDDISHWCFNFLMEVQDLEEKLGIDKKYQATRCHWNPTKDPNYGYYRCYFEHYENDFTICHEYCFRGESADETITFPISVLSDLENGLLNMAHAKEVDYQKKLRLSIKTDLLKIKERFKELKDMPSEFQKIIDSDFWELI